MPPAIAPITAPMARIMRNSFYSSDWFSREPHCLAIQVGTPNLGSIHLLNENHINITNNIHKKSFIILSFRLIPTLMIRIIIIFANHIFPFSSILRIPPSSCNELFGIFLRVRNLFSLYFFLQLEEEFQTFWQVIT